MIIVKIGGGQAINLEGIVEDLASLEEPVILVHGANTLRDEVAAQMGMSKQVVTSVKGISSVFSDQQAIDAILLAYSGLRNKRLVELCQQNEINAIGLTGLDGGLIKGRRNKGIRVMENGKKMLKRDFSGKPVSINTDLLTTLLDKGYTPVLTIPLCDESGTAINSENDDIVNCLQAAIDADTVIQLIEAPGYLTDKDDPTSVIDRLERAEMEALIEKVDGRMKRKMMALNKLVRGTVKKVIIADGRAPNPIKNALDGYGTWIE
ncbi:MAG: acetylglutamate/LysW-gamma-L-alpha-aminoadipate kinase [Parasphingorhabdus sp.]|jgi:acetylglutamate/LysW-gamma-L-alpha-aminoadipate kinase